MISFKSKNIQNMTDEELLSEYQQGQQRAFEILYHRHCDPLYRFILRQVKQQEALCEEIFQDVWTSVIRNSQQFRQESKFSTWLYTLARNRVIDYARKSKTHYENDHDSEEIVASAANEQPDHKAQLERCIELLMQSIQQLPAEQKEVFILKQETEHTLEELATITQTTMETVKSRIRYAMKKLREWLPGECL